MIHISNIYGFLILRHDSPYESKCEYWPLLFKAKELCGSGCKKHWTVCKQRV